MSINQKIREINTMIKRQLENMTLVSINSLQLPIDFILDNEESKKVENVISVDSKEQFENILLSFPNNKRIFNNVKDYNKPLYLAVQFTYPR